jgi:hypothetical protein
MDKQEKTTVRTTLRIAADLYAELAELARENSRIEPASINSTISFVLRKGLEAIKKEKSSGNSMPGYRKAA